MKTFGSSDPNFRQSADCLKFETLERPVSPNPGQKKVRRSLSRTRRFDNKLETIEQ